MASVNEYKEPRDPNKVYEIIYLRDQRNMRWRQIGAELGESHQGPYLLYKRWRAWAYRQGEWPC